MFDNKRVSLTTPSLVAMCALVCSTPGTASAELGCASNAAADLTTLVDQIAAMPEGGWIRVNSNRYDEVWTPEDLRPLSGALKSTPSKLIQAWSSFAWDCRRGDLLLYGGGHANYSGNDTYRWRATTGRWERMSLSSDMLVDGMGNTTAIDGPFAAPPAAHTYDNNIYLPIIDRFLVLGGSAWNNGGAYEMQTGPDTERITGPYLFDTSKADGAKVGGTTGSHVQRVAPHPEIVGGMMWQNRDLHALLPSSSLPSNHTSGTTAYAGSAGLDVVLVTARSGFSTNQDLFRFEFPDPNDATQDRVTKIGRYLGGVTGRGAGAFDPDLNAFVRTAIGKTDSVFYFWDLSHPGPSNPNIIFTPRDLSGGWMLDRGYGMDFDPVRGQYMLWGGNADVWILRAPATPTAIGWTIEKAPPPPTATAPFDDYDGEGLQSGGGVLGKWKYIPELDAFIGLQDTSAGNIWIYKPIGWIRPGTVQRPTLNISASSEQVFSGDDVTISWRSEGATSCVAQGSWTASRATSGSQLVSSLSSETSFGLRCDGPGGSITRSVTVAVGAIGPPTIDPVTSDNCLNAQESTTGLTVGGSGTAGATVVATLGGMERQATVDGAGSWSAFFSGASLATLSQGSLVITARQRNAQNVLSDPTTRTFTRDTVAPSGTTSIPRLLPSSDTGLYPNDGITRDTTPTFDGTSSAPNGSIALIVNGTTARLGKIDGSGRWTSGPGVLQPGSYSVAAAIADACANIGPTSGVTELTIDTSAPALKVSTVAGDGRINAVEASSTVTIAGTAEPASTIELGISYSGTPLITRSTTTAGNWSIALSPANLASLPDGTLRMKVVAIDVAGNRLSVSRNLVLDTSVAAPTINAVTGDDMLTVAERSVAVPLRGRAEAASTVVIQVTSWFRQVKADASGAWATDMPSTTAAKLPVGPVSISVTSTDRAGNVSPSTTREVNVLGPG